MERTCWSDYWQRALYLPKESPKRSSSVFISAWRWISVVLILGCWYFSKEFVLGPLVRHLVNLGTALLDWYTIFNDRKKDLFVSMLDRLFCLVKIKPIIVFYQTCQSVWNLLRVGTLDKMKSQFLILSRLKSQSNSNEKLQSNNQRNICFTTEVSSTIETRLQEAEACSMWSIKFVVGDLIYFPAEYLRG